MMYYNFKQFTLVEALEERQSFRHCHWFHGPPPLRELPSHPCHCKGLIFLVNLYYCFLTAFENSLDDDNFYNIKHLKSRY